MRAIRLPGVEKAILSDTVGFISDLPTQLVAAFRATLEEVTAADVIVHVRDMANPASSTQKIQVLEILTDLGVIDGEGGESRIPIVEAWNKWDILDEDRKVQLAELAHGEDSIVPISAITGYGLENLFELLSKLLTENAKIYDFVIPVGDGQRIAWLHANGEVLAEEPIAGEGAEEGGARMRMTVRLTPKEFGRYSSL